jgi:hydrogenase expression/formation protein HypC
MCLGIPGRIIAIDPEEPNVATVDVAGVRRRVDISCIVDEAHTAASCVGDWVLLHVGFAMARIDAEEARRTLDVIEQLRAVQDELESARGER